MINIPVHLVKSVCCHLMVTKPLPRLMVVWLVSDDQDLVNYVCKLSTQSRELVAHYEHTEIGHNYRMSNILAAIGIGQLGTLEQLIKRKREIFSYYQCHLSDLLGITFVEEMNYGRYTR